MAKGVPAGTARQAARQVRYEAKVEAAMSAIRLAVGHLEEAQHDVPHLGHSGSLAYFIEQLKNVADGADGDPLAGLPSLLERP